MSSAPPPPAPQRIVSLIASSTEILWALGLGDAMVGRSHECDWPPAVKPLPQCTEPKFRIDGTSADIDQQIRQIVEQGLSVYRVSAEILDALRPDLIVTQTQCEVCAVSLRDVEAAVCKLIASQPAICSLNPNCLSDVFADIRRVAAACSVVPAGQQLVDSLTTRIAAISQRAASSPHRPTVAYLEWIEPLMTGGNWMPELVALAGGNNLFGTAGQHSPLQSWASVVAADPEVLFICPCGFDIPRTQAELHLLQDKKEWPTLRAVRHDRVYIADGNQLFNRPGPRLVESLEVLAEVLHPELFHFGHKPRFWVRAEPSTSATR